LESEEHFYDPNATVISGKDEKEGVMREGRRKKEEDRDIGMKRERGRILSGRWF
jgi:hypothetical protein